MKTTPVRTARTLPLIVVAAVFLLWMTPGLVGRDLWKADEPYSFGMIYHIVNTGDWVVPTLAGEPFMEKPPLFYLTAAGFVRLLSPGVLTPHDAARMACVFYMLLTVLFIGLAARELFGRDHSAIAVIVLIGSAGLQVTAHKLITDISMIAGISMALYGLAVSRRRYAIGGLLLGTGAGIGFMSKGLLAPGMIGVTAILLPVIFAEWRRKSYFHTLLIACAAAVPWSFIWPVALYLRSPVDFIEWFWYQNLGRFLGYSHVGREFSWTFYFVHLPWFALPSLPIALWAIWHNRRSLRAYSGISIPLLMFLVMFLVLTLSSSIRNIYALPMLIPLSLLAAAGAGSLPDRAKRTINATGLVLFGALALLLWVGWIAVITGSPAFLSNKLHVFQPDYTPAFNAVLFAAACIYTALWFFAITRSARFEHAYLLNWTAGMVLGWGLMMTIWLPWLDAGSGYRDMFLSLREKIPARCNYVLMQGLGESERGLLQYYTGVLPRNITDKNIGECDFLLTQSGSEPVAPPNTVEWQLVWERWRPSKPQDRPKEIFTLLQRKEGKRNCQ